MFSHVQLHVHWMHLLLLGYADIPAYIYITPTVQTLHYCPASARG